MPLKKASIILFFVIFWSAKFSDLEMCRPIEKNDYNSAYTAVLKKSWPIQKAHGGCELTDIV